MIGKAICAGFFYHAAGKDQSEGYGAVADNQQVYIHPGSCLFNKNPEWVVYNELVMTTKEFMGEICVIEPNWLTEVAPHYFKKVTSISKRKGDEKIQPMYNRYEESGAWRLSGRKG